MTWRVPPFDQAAAEAEAHARASWSVHGVVMTGSIVRGNGAPSSDLDVIVVHREPWRLRDQRRFAGVATELFVNPPAALRRYFVSEDREGRPSTAHMLATGEVVGPADPIVHELIREAKEWLARPATATDDQLTTQRYEAVDLLDDARDIIARDPAAAALLLANAARVIIAHAFWKNGRRQPRRKDAVAALAEIDPVAATLVTRWASQTDAEALRTIEELARHVLGVDTFFEWTSPRDAVAEAT